MVNRGRTQERDDSSITETDDVKSTATKAGYITEYKMKILIRDTKANFVKRHERKINEITLKYEGIIKDFKEKIKLNEGEYREILEIANENSEKCEKIILKLRAELNEQNKNLHILKSKSENTSILYEEEK
mmetsp:Transcript_28256/g.24970  ORF Transcript_28256/g.24970 Transcript_28256/m.24970 type:complete len:131 (-) Transcript_28256:567-959(-)